MTLQSKDRQLCSVKYDAYTHDCFMSFCMMIFDDICSYVIFYLFTFYMYMHAQEACHLITYVALNQNNVGVFVVVNVETFQ